MSKKIKKGYDFPMVEALRAIPEHYQIDNIRIKKLFAVLYHYSRINKHMAFTLGQDVIARELGIDRTTVYRNIQNLVGYYDYVIYLPGRKGLNSVYYIVKPDEDKDSIELRDKMPEPLLNRYDTLCSGSQLYVAKSSQLTEMQCVIEKMQHNIEAGTDDYVTNSSQSVESEEVTEEMPHNVSDPNATLIYNNIINKKENINNKKEIVSKSNSKVPKEKSTQDSNGVGNLEGTDVVLTTTKDFNNFHMSESNTQETLEVKNLKEQITALQLESEQLKNEFEDKMKEIRNWYDTKKKPYIDQLQNELNAVREENEELKATIAQLQSKQQAPLVTTTSNSDYKDNLDKFYKAKSANDLVTTKHYLDILNSLENLTDYQIAQVQKANVYYQEALEKSSQSNCIPDSMLDEADRLNRELKRASTDMDKFNSYSHDELMEMCKRIVALKDEIMELHQKFSKRDDWHAALRRRDLLFFINPKHELSYISELVKQIAVIKLMSPEKTDGGTTVQGESENVSESLKSGKNEVIPDIPQSNPLGNKQNLAKKVVYYPGSVPFSQVSPYRPTEEEIREIMSTTKYPPVPDDSGVGMTDEGYAIAY